MGSLARDDVKVVHSQETWGANTNGVHAIVEVVVSDAIPVVDELVVLDAEVANDVVETDPPIVNKVAAINPVVIVDEDTATSDDTEVMTPSST